MAPRRRRILAHARRIGRRRPQERTPAVEYVQLGSSGLLVSKFVFGALTFAGTRGFEAVGTATGEEARRQIDLARLGDQGIAAQPHQDVRAQTAPDPHASPDA